jgi:hypothetical protein
MFRKLMALLLVMCFAVSSVTSAAVPQSDFASSEIEEAASIGPSAYILGTDLWGTVTSTSLRPVCSIALNCVRGQVIYERATTGYYDSAFGMTDYYLYANGTDVHGNPWVLTRTVQGFSFAFN